MEYLPEVAQERNGGANNETVVHTQPEFWVPEQTTGKVNSLRLLVIVM